MQSLKCNLNDHPNRKVNTKINIYTQIWKMAEGATVTRVGRDGSNIGKLQNIVNTAV